MTRDADSRLQLGFLIKFVEPDLKPEEIETETQYLRDDLLDLSGMGQTRFQFLYASRGELKIREGLRFEIAPDRLHPILRRLCNRLKDRPLETLVLIYYDSTKLQIQTHRADELASMMAAAEFLITPESIYLAKAETYILTRGELSPAEEFNLKLLAQQLDLPPETIKTLKAKATGPLKSLEDKRQRFVEVMTTEVAQDYPPSEDTRQILKEMAEYLKLPNSIAEELYQDHIQKIQAKIEAQRQQQQEAQEAAKQEAEELARLEQQQYSEAEHQQQLEQYREMFRQAIQNSFYPLAYDQGRLEQSRQLWQIAEDTARHIEEEVRSELFGHIQSAAGIDYSRLRQLLWSQAWKEADKETENVIFKAVSHDMQPLDRDAILGLPCLDLLTIDQLWSRHSNSKFGFQRQYKIFQEEADRRPQDFQRLLDWRNSGVNLTGELKPYRNITFDLSAPAGHLPTWRWCCTSLEGGYQIGDAIIEAFFLHLEKCLSADSNSTSAAPNLATPWDTSRGA
jgi:hypothetical protein